MEVLGIIIGILLILGAIAITAVVLLQSSRNARQSGVISGGAESFFGKSKGKEMDRKLNKLTLVVAIVFVALVLVMYIVQPDKAKANYGDIDAYLSEAQNTTVTSEVTTTVPVTTADEAVTTAPVTDAEPDVTDVD